MKANLLLHPSTDAHLKAFIAHPAHAVLVLGPAGSGKTSFVHEIGSKILETNSFTNHQYVRLLDANEGEGIAQVREIRKFLGLKTAGTGKIRRVVLVENVDSLGGDAQNALLKTLEEPPEDTVIILTATQKGLVLDTILSRVHELKILPLTEDVCLNQAGYTQAELKKAFALSGGLAGSFIALLEAGSEHPLVNSVAIAKEFLASSPYERLSLVDTISKNKEEVGQLLNGLEMCLYAALKNTKQHTLKPTHEKLELIINTKQAFNRSANTKLLLTALSVNL